MSAAERPVQQYGAIIVVGGGCYGGYYVRQLDRAARAGAISARQIIVVDRDADCPVARHLRSEPRPVVATHVVVAEWREYFDEYLGYASNDVEAVAADAVVPSPLMPHLMGEWLVGRARRRWPDREVVVSPFDRVPAVPWERAGNDGSHYVSFATWMCPINCIEPRICPHTRDERTWSMPDALRDYAGQASSDATAPVVATVHCRHRSYGVGMFDTMEVLDADRRIAQGGAGGRVEVIIGTVSHCHGALTRLIVEGPTARISSHVG